VYPCLSTAGQRIAAMKQRVTERKTPRTQRGEVTASAAHALLNGRDEEVHSGPQLIQSCLDLAQCVNAGIWNLVANEL
jgi:hypothetical protein